jgi:outer membrane protein
MSARGLVAALLLALSSVPASAQPAPPAPDARLGLLDAIQSTLERHPLLHIQEQQVELNRGVAQQAGGQFDLSLDTGLAHNRLDTPLTVLQRQQAAQAGIPTGRLLTNLTQFQAGPRRLFRNGVGLGTSIEITRTADNLTNLPGLNQSSVSLQLALPLLRGRGRSVVAAEETAADLEVGASELDLSQTVTDLAASAAIAYWNGLAARERLEVAQGSEERGRNFVDSVKTLVDADRVPRAELYTVTANLADRKANRIAATQTVVEARENLALAMGLQPEEAARLGVPADPFPDDEKTPVPEITPELVDQYVKEALARRGDLLASRKREDRVRTLQVAARNLLKPRMDLNLSAGYAGLAEGRTRSEYFNSIFRSVDGPQASAAVSFSFPAGNNAAQGQLAQADAALRQSELQSSEVSRSIAATVIVALQGVRNAALRLESARESVSAFQSSLDGERDKFRLGIGSLVSILTVEDRLTSALISLVQARLSYAVALTQLRQATGTVVAAGTRNPTIDRTTFVTMPFGPEAATR